MSHFLKITETDTSGELPPTVVAHVPVPDALALTLGLALQSQDANDASPGDGKFEAKTPITLDQTLNVFGFKWRIRVNDNLISTFEVTDEAPVA